MKAVFVYRPKDIVIGLVVLFALGCFAYAALDFYVITPIRKKILTRKEGKP